MKPFLIILFSFFCLALSAQEQPSKYSSKKFNNYSIILIEDSTTYKPEHFNRHWNISNDSLTMFLKYLTSYKQNGLKLQIKRSYILQIFSYFNNHHEKMLDIVLVSKKYFKQHGVLKYPSFQFLTWCFTTPKIKKEDRITYLSLNCTNLLLSVGEFLNL